MHWGMDRPPDGNELVEKRSKKNPVRERSRPKFVEAIEESPQILHQFVDGEAVTKDHAAGMQIYMCHKYGMSSKVS